MINRKMRMAAFGLAAAMLVSNISIDVNATTLSSTLPSAGAAVTLNGSSITIADATAAPQAEAKTADVKLTAGAETVVDAAAQTGTQVIPTDGAAVIDVSDVVDASAQTVSGADAIADSAEAQYANLVIAKCNDYVNVRQEPNEESEILGKLYDKSVGDFVSETDGWYQITSGSVTGYVKAEYVVTGQDAIALAKEVGKRIATVNTVTLFVREEPTVDSRNLGMVGLEDDLTVLEEDGLDGWVKVPIEEGEGYVSTEFVDLTTEFVKAESKAEEEARLAKEEADRKAANAAASKKSGKSSSSSGSSAAVSGGSGAGSGVASYALQFVGNPYVYGGSSLTNGTDCSGFVMSVYANYGVSLPHSSGAQRSCGTDVGGLANAQPGDIVCYSGHVGIYIGGGQIVHASTAATGIKVSNADYRSVLSVRRIF